MTYDISYESIWGDTVANIVKAPALPIDIGYELAQVPITALILRDRILVKKKLHIRTTMVIRLLVEEHGTLTAELSL